MGERAFAILELQGRLLSNAHAAQKQLDAHGHFAPTLCFEVEALGSRKVCKVEQYFPAGQEVQCEAAARHLKRGDVVSFHVDTERLVYKACGVSHVHKVQPAPSSHAEPQDAQTPLELHA